MMTKIIAHRGSAGKDSNENTIESFKDAIRLGVDMVEFDVRKTLDNVLIVTHDPTIDGKTVATLTDTEICAGDEARGYHIPTFKDVIKICHNRVFMDIELKEHGYEKYVLHQLRKYSNRFEYSIKGFDDIVSYTVKRIDPMIKTGLLIGRRENDVKRRFNEIFPQLRMRQCKADFISPYYGFIYVGYLRRLHKLGYPVYVWTVNKPKAIKQMLKLGVDGIITDRPDIAMELRKEYEEKNSKLHFLYR